MGLKDKSLIAFTALTIFGGLAVFTLPLRTPVAPAPESGLTTEPCTLDAAIEKEEEIILQNKAYLDGLLAQAMEESREAETVILDPIEIITEPETTDTEPETTETETETAWHYQPVDCLMDPALQEWVYDYGCSQAISPYLIMAICERESGCTERILGDNGNAFGIMQVQVRWVPDKLAAHGWTSDDMLRAEPCIVIGVEILKQHLLTGRGMEYALTAYRYGPQQAQACAQSDYSAEILRRAAELEAQKWDDEYKEI